MSVENHPLTKGQKSILQAYDHHLRQVVGLSPKTCRDRWRDLSSFLKSVRIEQIRHMTELTPMDLVNYLTERSRHSAPASLRNIGSSLRHFLRFARQRAWVRQDLDLGVPKIACGPQNDLPVFLSRPQLASLLASWDRTTPEGARDLAIGLCLAKLALRAGEVAALRLEDIDWRRGTLRINQSKTGSPAQLPLRSEVGSALADYLRNARPVCRARHIFLTTADARPMSSRAISQVIRRALERCQIAVPRPGAHLLRHTLASHLVQNGASLKEVADLLRHRDLNSTAVYAHVDIPNLATLAHPWPMEDSL